MSVAGPNCQTNINECASNPCLNQGTCIDDVAGYKCNCLLPYTGTKHTHTHFVSLSFSFIHTHTLTQMHRHPSVRFTRHRLAFCSVCVCLNILCAFYQSGNFWYISCISTSYFLLRGKLRIAGNCSLLYYVPGKCPGNNSVA